MRLEYALGGRPLDANLPQRQIYHPDRSLNSDYDPALSAETRRRFRDSHCETDILVLTDHFPSPSVGLVVPHAERDFDFEYLPSASAI